MQHWFYHKTQSILKYKNPIFASEKSVGEMGFTFYYSSLYCKYKLKLTIFNVDE